MLVLSRKVGEKIMVGDNIELEFAAIGGNRVQIGITAPREVLIVRSELKAFGIEPEESSSNCIVLPFAQRTTA